MAKNDAKNRGINPDPSDTGRPNESKQQEQKEGDFRNAEDSKQDTSFFNDDYEVGQEDEISREEAKTEERGGRKTS